jgi:RimJ/RimL family protein N-acetyltransferase
MNQQSCTAIERLGARLDGVLRQHQIGRMAQCAIPASTAIRGTLRCDGAILGILWNRAAPYELRVIV